MLVVRGDGFPVLAIAALAGTDESNAYWTNRDEASGYRDGFIYTEENIRRVRKNVGDDDAVVHAIGGIADTAATSDYLGFVKAADRRDAIGYSVYDFNTTTSGVWARLREG
jgi:hypothetical protein